MWVMLLAQTGGHCVVLHLRAASIYICYVFKKSKGRSIIRNIQIITELDSLAREQDEVSIITRKIKCLEQRWVLDSPEKDASAFEFLGLVKHLECFRSFGSSII